MAYNADTNYAETTLQSTLPNKGREIAAMYSVVEFTSRRRRDSMPIAYWGQLGHGIFLMRHNVVKNS